MPQSEQFDPQTGEILETPPTPHPPAKKKRARKKANGRVPIPADETPKQRFLRSSATRMEQALTAIDLIASFGRNRTNYEYDETEANQLYDRLAGALSRMARELARPPSRAEERKAERKFSW
jgi:hypothetical protein